MSKRVCVRNRSVQNYFFNYPKLLLFFKNLFCQKRKPNFIW